MKKFWGCLCEWFDDEEYCSRPELADWAMFI